MTLVQAHVHKAKHKYSLCDTMAESSIIRTRHIYSLAIRDEAATPMPKQIYTFRIPLLSCSTTRSPRQCNIINPQNMPHCFRSQLDRARADQQWLQNILLSDIRPYTATSNAHTCIRLSLCVSVSQLCHHLDRVETVSYTHLTLPTKRIV